MAHNLKLLNYHATERVWNIKGQARLNILLLAKTTAMNSNQLAAADGGSGSGSSSSSIIHEQFEQDGFVGSLDIISTSEAQCILKDVTTELSKPNSNRFKLHLVLPGLSKLAHHPILVDAVQQALQTKNILLWSSDINIKQPNSKGYFAPHQDSTYAGLTPPTKCLTAWIALSDPVGSDEGCLSFYPQPLHKSKQLPHETTTTTTTTKNDNKNDDNMLSLGQYISMECLKENNLKNSKQIPLRGGQATLHSFYSVHYSGPNNTTKYPRVGFALRYISGGDEVKQSKPIKEMVTWISGSENKSNNNEVVVLQNFDIEPTLSLYHPTKEEIQNGYQAQEEAMRRENANYFVAKK